MKKTINKKALSKKIDKTRALKWVIIGLGIAVVAAWIVWFSLDCVFISKGITTDWEKVWDWNETWYRYSNIAATITLSITGGYIVLLVSYMVICGLNIRDNLKYYIYQLVVTAASFITMTLCIVKAGEMMVNEKYVLDISFVPLNFDVYHLDYLKWMSIALGCAVFTNVLILSSFRLFEKDTLIKDCNLLVIVFAGASIILFIPFMISFGWNDPFVGGAELPSEWIALVEHSITWKHVVAQCVTSPMGVFAGMIMVLLVIRIISVIFAYNKRWVEKKSHIIIFGIIGFLVFAAFIVAHANKLDFVKLINDYNSMKLGGLLVVLAQTVTCIAAGTYCLISHINYQKRAI